MRFFPKLIGIEGNIHNVGLEENITLTKIHCHLPSLIIFEEDGLL